MKARDHVWCRAGAPLPPRGVLAEDFSLLVRSPRRLRVVPRQERTLQRYFVGARARVALLC